MNKTIRQNVLPVLAAVIWGFAFIFQKQSTVGTFTFCAARFFLGFVVLSIFLALRGKTRRDKTPVRRNKKQLILGGIACGVALFVASNLQQAALPDVDAGKAGFVTALYIVLVPLFSLFFGKRAPLTVWMGVFLAAGGMYCLCLQGSGMNLQPSDLLLVGCAVVYAVHILVIDHYTQFADGVELSCLQMLTAGVLSLVFALFTETIVLQDLLDCLVPILYVGIFSSGVAYTLQVVAQTGTNPTVVSLLLSLESLFSAVAGALINGERMNGFEYVGCALMAFAVLLAQLPSKQTVK